MTVQAVMALYEAETAPYRRTVMRWHDAEIDQIRQFLAWAKREGIDPARWIRARLDRQARGTKDKRRFKPVTPKGLISRDRKLLAEFREWRDGRAADAIGQEVASRAVVEDRRDGRLVPHEENLKARWSRVDPEVCRVLSEGWHAESRWCRSCPRPCGGRP